MTMFLDAHAALDSKRPKPAGVRISADELSTGLDEAMGLDTATAERIETTTRTRLYEKLREIAGEMLAASGHAGVSFDDVRLEAQNRNVLTGAESLSFGSKLMASLDTIVIGWRRSKIKSAHRRRVAVYRLLSIHNALTS